MPAISVLLPVRDAGPYLAPALASLWRQSEADFEVIAVDDGSRDGSGERLERAARLEPRLRVLHTPARGLPAALNLALAHARGPLIARQDADDLSHRDRLALERAYLEAHPESGLVGCRVRLFPARVVRAGMRRWAMWHNALVDHEAMAREAFIDSPLAHGTVLIRREWLDRARGWAEHGWAEDLDLWLRLLEAGARFAKLPRTLYGWRQHDANATRRDPRYARERFVALKSAAPARGPLRGASEVTLIGTGRSLSEWSAALARAGLSSRAITAAHPSHLYRLDPRAILAAHPARLARLEPPPPALLVFGAEPARARWRAALAAWGCHEGPEFIFVA